MSNIDGLINFNDGAAVGGRSLFIPWGTSKQAAIKMRLLEVRFRVDDEEERRKLGVVRIRLVVTREELRQILNGEESGPGYSSSEELLAAIKLGSRRRTTSSRIRMDDQRFSSSDGDVKSRKWRPALESIPEF
nr:uncharacterized protein LOC7462054 [Ipomoea batatas]